MLPKFSWPKGMRESTPQPLHCLVYWGWNWTLIPYGPGIADQIPGPNRPWEPIQVEKSPDNWKTGGTFMDEFHAWQPCFFCFFLGGGTGGTWDGGEDKERIRDMDGYGHQKSRMYVEAVFRIDWYRIQHPEIIYLEGGVFWPQPWIWGSFWDIWYVF